MEKLSADANQVSIYNLDERSAGDNADAWSDSDEKVLFKSGM